jgi:hypothetical protein
MKIVRLLAPGVVALACLSCKSGGAAWEPVVIDISASRTPSPTETPAAVPTMTSAPAAPSPTPTALPTPIPTAPPAPASATPESPRPALAAVRAPESVAQSRIEAYNRHDLEGIAALYAQDARVFDPPDRLRDSGIEQIRQTYARRFSSAPRTRLAVAQRMTEGTFVVEREMETGGDGRSASAIVISEIRDGKIVRVWILR